MRRVLSVALLLAGVPSRGDEPTQSPPATPTVVPSQPATAPSSVPTQSQTTTATPETVTGAFVIEIGTVRVATTRPGTDRPWDTVVETRKPDMCSAAAGAGAALGEAGGGGGAAEMIGSGVQNFCRFLRGDQQSTKRITQDFHMPDVFIRLRTGGRSPVSYRTKTAENCYMHSFGSRFVVPAESVPPAGVQIQVVDDDGSEGSNDIIGEIRMSRSRLREISQQPDPTLTVKDGGVESMTVTVTMDTPTDDVRHVNLTATVGVGYVQNLSVDAGQVVEACVEGAIKFPNGFWMPPVGVPLPPESDRALEVDPENWTTT